MNIMMISVMIVITSSLMTLVASETGFQNPNVTVTCSNGPTNNTVNVTWSPVHKNYDSVEKIMKYEEFQFCKIELNCENGFKKVVPQCKRGKITKTVFEWRSIPSSENFCNVTVKYRDYYDSDQTVFSTSKDCYFEYPIVNVSVTPVNTTIMGQPLMLQCTVVTWSGLHDSVEMVWMINNNERRRISVQNVPKSSVNNLTIYSDYYYNNSEISLQDNGTNVSCQIKINELSSVNDTSNFTLIVIDPIINVSITPVKTTILGQPLMLECAVVAWSDLHDSVEMVWRTNNNERRKTIRNVTKSSVNNLTIYTDYYNISDITLQDYSNEFSCLIELKIPSSVNYSSVFILNTTVSPTSTSLPVSTISTPTVISNFSNPVNDLSGSISLIFIVMPSTITVFTVTAIIIICGTILLRNRSRETEQSSKNLSNLTSQTTLAEDCYYSSVSIEELSVCEDVEGMGLQDATADNSKEEYKEFTDYYSMLRSLVYPKLTTDFKKNYKSNSHEIPSEENSPGGFIDVLGSLSNPEDDNDDNHSDTTESGSAPTIVDNKRKSENEKSANQFFDLQHKCHSTLMTGEYIDEATTSDHSCSCDLVSDMSALAANSILVDQSFSLQKLPHPKPSSGDYTDLNSHTNSSFLSTLTNHRPPVEQCPHSTLEYLDELSAATQTVGPSPANDKDNTYIQSTSETGEYTDLSASGKFISSSEQILSHSSVNNTSSTFFPSSQHVCRPTSTIGEYLTDYLSTAEQISTEQINTTNGTKSLDIFNSSIEDKALQVNKNGYVEESEI